MSNRTAVNLSVRFKVMQRDKFRCCLCGKTAQDTSRLEVDHKVPVSKGGGNDLANLWTLCFECNRGKQAKSLSGRFMELKPTLHLGQTQYAKLMKLAEVRKDDLEEALTWIISYSLTESGIVDKEIEFETMLQAG